MTAVAYRIDGNGQGWIPVYDSIDRAVVADRAAEREIDHWASAIVPHTIVVDVVPATLDEANKVTRIENSVLHRTRFIFSVVDNVPSLREKMTYATHGDFTAI